RRATVARARAARGRPAAARGGGAARRGCGARGARAGRATGSAGAAVRGAGGARLLVGSADAVAAISFRAQLRLAGGVLVADIPGTSGKYGQDAAEPRTRDRRRRMAPMLHGFFHEGHALATPVPRSPIVRSRLVPMGYTEQRVEMSRRPFNV